MIIESLYLGTLNQKKAQMKKTQDDWKGLKKIISKRSTKAN